MSNISQELFIKKMNTERERCEVMTDEQLEHRIKILKMAIEIQQAKVSAIKAEMLDRKKRRFSN